MGGWSEWLLCCVCAVTSVTVGGVRVRTSLGELEGDELTTSSGRRVHAFLGVPYARPPLGEDRFKEPKPTKSWSGVWPARDYSPECIQFSIFGDTAGQIVGSEDCLYLNVFSPKISQSSSLPVLVFFHGGAFTFGQGRPYNPDYILDRHDIVFVNVNYRLGPFGFLSTQDGVVPGNNGLKDQVVALKWINEHISAFGGDPGRVTIAGSSAGGASVQYHFLSPQSRGLFSGGISASGSALMPWALTERPLAKAMLLSEAVGCPVNETRSMVRCLRQRPSRQILSQVKPLFIPWLYNPFTPFGPVVENSSRNPFLIEHPYQLLKRGETFDGPWLASLTTEEGLYPAADFVDREELLCQLDQDWVKIAPHLLDFNGTVASDSSISVSNAVRKQYLGNEAISTKNVDKLIKMVGDRLFNADMNLAARLQASATTSPVYVYTFDYRGNISLSDVMSRTGADFGVSHFDDMYYLLAVPEAAACLSSATYQAMVRTMTDLWASFVQTGRPLPQPWSPVQGDSGLLTHMMIRGPSEVQETTTDDLGNYQFWTSLGLEENENINFGDDNIIFSKCEL